MINYTALLSAIAGNDQGTPAIPVMIGNEDEVQVLLLSLGIATHLQAFHMMGVFRGILKVTAGMLLIVAFFWPEVAQALPALADTVQHLAVNGWAWLVLLLVVIFMNSLLPALKRAS